MTIILFIIFWALLVIFLLVLLHGGKVRQQEQDAREFRRYFLNKRDGGER